MSETVEAAPALSTPYEIGVEAYISADYARAERDKLWAKVWQQVGRVEELPKVGDYLTYDILDDSIIVVRSAPDKFRAYYNVCSHRGRRLLDTPAGQHDVRGRGRGFVCGYHGWKYNLEGENTFVAEKQDWPCGLTDDKIRLTNVKVDTWGGWIWINLDPNAEPLRQYLEPAASLLDAYQTEKFRYRWRRWLVFDCNWKVALEAFMEIYHVPYTHPEFNQFGAQLGWARAQGKHSNIGFEAPKGLEGNQGKVRIAEGGDARLSTAVMQNFIWANANTNTTETLVEVANRLEKELPEGTPPPEVLKYWMETARREDAEQGVIWPTIPPDVANQSGTAFQIFPNFQIGQGQNNMLCYSARPHGYDPDKCIFEVAVYQLYPEGQAPETTWEYTPEDSPEWRTVLPQDFSNMAAVQQGMKVRGFSGPKPNPYSERSVVNLHHNLAKYMGTGAPRALTEDV
jgi:nitrite reductase/ring-hydroxylating ferredoxin subunit